MGQSASACCSAYTGLRMMTDAKKQRLAKKLDTRVRYLRLTGLNDMALLAAMSDQMLDFKVLMDMIGPDGMEGFTQRLPDLRHYAVLLASVVAAICDGTITAPR